MAKRHPETFIHPERTEPNDSELQDIESALAELVPAPVTMQEVKPVLPLGLLGIFDADSVRFKLTTSQKSFPNDDGSSSSKLATAEVPFRFAPGAVLKLSIYQNIAGIAVTEGDSTFYPARLYASVPSAGRGTAALTGETPEAQADVDSLLEAVIVAYDRMVDGVVAAPVVAKQRGIMRRIPAKA